MEVQVESPTGLWLPHDLRTFSSRASEYESLRCYTNISSHSVRLQGITLQKRTHTHTDTHFPEPSQDSMTSCSRVALKTTQNEADHQQLRAAQLWMNCVFVLFACFYRPWGGREISPTSRLWLRRESCWVRAQFKSLFFGLWIKPPTLELQSLRSPSDVDVNSLRLKAETQHFVISYGRFRYSGTSSFWIHWTSASMRDKWCELWSVWESCSSTV